MEGVIFYWFSWIGWVISTFFMKKDRKRLVISGAILVFIIGSNYSLYFGEVSVRLTFVFLVMFTLTSLAVTIKGWALIYFLICSLIITMGYVGFHLFELFDPVWLLFDRKWMLSIAMIYLVLMLLKDSYHRLFVLFVGVCNGEILYTFILRKFSFPHEIGAFEFLDVITIMTLLIVIWNILEKVTMMWETHFQTRMKGKGRLKV